MHKDGVLILGSGNIANSLYDANLANMDAEPDPVRGVGSTRSSKKPS